MLGYIFFALSSFFCVGLAFLTASKPNLTGDNAMGYGLSLFFLGLGFALSSLTLTIILYAKGGFNWAIPSNSPRFVLVFSAWLVMASTTFFCAVFKWEWHNDTTYPQYLHWLAVHHGQLLTPFLWLSVCFFSLNTEWQSANSSSLLKISFWAGLGIGTLFGLGLLVGYMHDSIKTTAIEIAGQREQEDQWHRQVLADIAAHKPEDPIINLLSQSTRYRPDDIREAAIAKIKSHPNWEAEILRLLNDKKAYLEVYYFLDGNKVEHPKEFIEPLRQSIIWVSATIKADIEDSNNLQSWSFESYKIDRLLRAIDDQFLNQGVDFYPSILKLKQALNTTPPERFKGVRFTTTDLVNAWLKDHKPKK